MTPQKYVISGPCPAGSGGWVSCGFSVTCFDEVPQERVVEVLEKLLFEVLGIAVVDAEWAFLGLPEFEYSLGVFLSPLLAADVGGSSHNPSLSGTMPGP